MLTTPLDWIVFVLLMAAIGVVVWWALQTFTESRTLVFVLGVSGMLLFPIMAIIALDLANPAKTGVEAYEAQRGMERKQKALALKAKWKKEMTTVAWVDKEKGLAQIPLKVAVQLELTALNERKPKPAGPVVPAVPPAPAPAPAESKPEATGNNEPGSESATEDSASQPVDATSEGGEQLEATNATPAPEADRTQPEAAQ